MEYLNARFTDVLVLASMRTTPTSRVLQLPVTIARR